MPAPTGDMGGGALHANSSNPTKVTMHGSAVELPQMTKTTSCGPGFTPFHGGFIPEVFNDSMVAWTPVCLPANVSPIWQLNNTSCDDYNYITNGSDQWSHIGGDRVVDNLTKTFEGNLPFCPECLGQPVSDCDQAKKDNPNYNPDCAVGLGDAADGRWDRAAAHFANLADQDDLACGIGASGCGGSPSCKGCNGPGVSALPAL
jgi:hypothetical protein